MLFLEYPSFGVYNSRKGRRMMERGSNPERAGFENFKSTVCHKVKTIGDIDFILDVLKNEEIRMYFNRQWYPECFYILGMVDYLSGIHDIPLCNDYDDLRKMKLEHLVFPLGVLAMEAVEEDGRAREQALKEAIPEFLRFNIVESGVWDVA